MKRFLLILLAALFVAELSAQQLRVVNFEKRERDLTAKTKPRTDNNGDICALLRVQVAAPNCQFSDSYIVGDVELGFGEYLVYMAKGARRLRIAHPDFLFTTLDYEFPEPLQSMTTYTLILEVPVYTHYAEIVEQQSKNKSTQPSAQMATKPAEKIYKVGDYYNENGKEGVVFWVDETGKHGKIVSMKGTNWRVNWCEDKNERKRIIGADDETDGTKNFAVVKQISDWKEKYPAFAWCADLGEGWYLPAKGELVQIYKMINFLGKAFEGIKKMEFWLWSSTECGPHAWTVNVNNGMTNHKQNYKCNFSGCVRAIAAF